LCGQFDYFGDSLALHMAGVATFRSGLAQPAHTLACLSDRELLRVADRDLAQAAIVATVSVEKSLALQVRHDAQAPLIRVCEIMTGAQRLDRGSR
jgi:hypothetical protein